MNVERRNANDALPEKDIGFYLLPLGKHAGIMQASDWLASAGSHPHKFDPTHTHIQTPTDSLGHSRGPHVALKKIQTHTHTHTQTPGGRAQILRIRHGSCVCGCVCCNLQTMATNSSGQVPQYIETYYI